MNIAIRILLIANFVLTLALGSYTYFKPSTKTAFVYNEKVFQGFKGTEELKNKLKQTHAQVSTELDSLAKLIEAGRSDLEVVYQQKLEAAQATQTEMSEQFTAEIWKQINQYVAEYGEKEGYGLIHGAAGNGGLMYANEGLDVTEDVLKYINARYQGDE